MTGNLTTGVDALVSYLKERDKVEVSKAAKDLGVSEDTLQVWVEFLVEEKILGMEYKLTTPLIFYLGKGIDSDSFFQSARRIKKEFISSLNKKMSDEEKEKEWKIYAINLLMDLKPYFIQEAKIRNLSGISTFAWQVFVNRFLK